MIAWHHDGQMPPTLAPRTYRMLWLFAIVVRIALTATTYGTNDAHFKTAWVHLVERVGIAHAYAVTPMLNHPPLSLAYMMLFDAIAALLGIAYTDVFRGAQIAADVVSAYALFRIGRAESAHRAPVLASFVLLSPAAAFLSAFHCNTDPTMTALVVLAASLAVVPVRSFGIAVGVTLGLAAGIKILPFVLAPITRRSVAMAQADAAARERGVSLFHGLSIPLSHWSGDDPPPAFDTAKIKCGPDFDVARLPQRVRLRLDFNASLRPAQFEEIAPGLPDERVEFVEDPCPYDEATWTRLRRTTGVRLALDRGTGSAADVLVVKPAVQELPAGDDREIVITSYMDHAVGQFGAVYVAAANSSRVSARCGLFSHELFERDEFFACIAADGARLLPPEGTGVGFDALLERLPWKKLA